MKTKIISTKKLARIRCNRCHKQNDINWTEIDRDEMWELVKEYIIQHVKETRHIDNEIIIGKINSYRL